MEHLKKHQDNSNSFLHKKKNSYSKRGSQLFFPPSTLQPMLSINQPNDIYEKEADAVAEKVMKMPSAETSSPFFKPSSAQVQRKCTECEEEEKRMQRKEMSGEAVNTETGLEDYTGNLNNGGEPLPKEARNFFEPRFGYDFGNVKIFSDSAAQHSAQSINALAYTSGNNIVFNRNKFAPYSSEGRRLLAHELTHVVQQRSGPISSFISPVIQKQEGTSRLEDTVSSQSHNVKSGIWTGEIDRREYIPAHGKTPQRTLGTLSGVRISFNSNTCMVTLPSKVKFEHPNGTNWPRCGADRGHPVPKNPLSSNAFNSLKQKFIRLSNQWLNGWYKVRLTNCKNNCAGKDMNINVVIVEDNTNPDTTVVLANTTGRSCASPSQVTLHARGLRGGGIKDDRIIHESGHMAIGYLDEYPVSQGNSDVESVRRDFSLAGSHSDFKDWMQLHERHFSLVTEFLRTIFPGCNPELVQIPRSEIDFELTGTLGYTDYQEGGYYLDLGLDFELPLNKKRNWELFLGAHSHLLYSITQPDRTAFMAGARLGFQHTFGISSGGFQWGGFGELGYGSFGREKPGTQDSEHYQAPFYLVGGNIGYSFAPSSGRIPFISAEGGIGSTLLSDQDRSVYGNNKWFFVGLNGGFQWR